MVTFNFSAVHTRIESKTCFRLPPSAFLKMAFFLWLIFELGSDSIKRSHDPSRNQWDCSIVHLTGLHQLWPRYTVLAECTWSSKGGKNISMIRHALPKPLIYFIWRILLKHLQFTALWFCYMVLDFIVLRSEETRTCWGRGMEKNRLSNE